MEKLINLYLEFLKNNIILKPVGDYTSITIPWINDHNDCIQFYIRKENETIFLTDDGYTITDLECRGIFLNNSKNKEKLDKALSEYDLELDINKCIIKKFNTNVAYNLHMFIQGLIIISNII